jgi:hypothetical protein
MCNLSGPVLGVDTILSSCDSRVSLVRKIFCAHILTSPPRIIHTIHTTCWPRNGSRMRASNTGISEGRIPTGNFQHMSRFQNENENENSDTVQTIGSRANKW